MKKLLLVLVSLLLCLGMVACGKVDSEIVGKYKIQSQTEDGVTLDLNNLKSRGMENDYIEIKEDGIVIFVEKGVAQEGKINTDKKTITFDMAGEEMSLNYSIDGDTLVLDDGLGFKTTYKK